LSNCYFDNGTWKESLLYSYTTGDTKENISKKCETVCSKKHYGPYDKRMIEKENKNSIT